MNATDLDDCEESYLFLLRDAIGKIHQDRTQDAPYFIVETCHRILASCALLKHADVSAFLERLDRAGTARLRLLELAATGVKCDPQIMAISKSPGFPAALASGNAGLASDLGRYLPWAHDPMWEYEDDFLFSDFLRHLAVGTALHDDSWVGPARTTLDRWSQALKGREAPAFRMCEAMWGREAAAFSDAFGAFVRRRVSQLEKNKASASFDAKAFAAEGRVFVEGFAVLELATRLGLPSERDYPLLPSLGRFARSRRTGASPDWLLA